MPLTDGPWRMLGPSSPEVNYNLLRLLHVEDESDGAAPPG